ncbi:NAD(P)-dependent oxidoreductase [Burkholderia sp. Bp9143]|uniref:NAD(P)-dependent oxidoreductase n=1 Tax=Burkholderia sp. Bp9143 TaxID=2184574 RepID=UPI000F5A252E|nr:NAD(P)-dependent oxidoreductase [Burkholderia sp. Bp9143]RQR31424.1 NAD(P)-dependent oxidoreductase [Burkholderia sp. Bp9143]
MKKVGVVGLGNMGMGMAKNLVAGEFAVTAYDMSKDKLDDFVAYGGKASANVAAVGAASDVVFVMVVDARQTRDVLVGNGKLLASMKPGSVVVLTATIGSPAVREMGEAAKEYKIHVIDSPVSGGRIGADAGELTLMMSGNKEAYEMCLPAFKAIAKNINYIGEEIGKGQVMKACLQGLVGCIYSGIFEVLALGVKAGLSAESIFNVIGTSVANTPIFQNTVPVIMDRKFTGSGSNIYNTYKDLTITMALAQENGVPMMTTGVATQFFQAANTRYPTDDNQCLIKLLEEVIGVEVKRANT